MSTLANAHVGHWFPPGAWATLIRELSYFPAADTSFPWLALATWALGGILLSLVGHFREAGGAEPDDAATDVTVGGADISPSAEPSLSR